MPDLSQARWFKSSRSSNNGACVETAFLTTSPDWRKSSRSANNGDCVETKVGVGRVAVRDSKDPEGTVLLFSADSWVAFVAGVKADGFATV